MGGNGEFTETESTFKDENSQDSESELYSQEVAKPRVRTNEEEPSKLSENRSKNHLKMHSQMKKILHKNVF